LFFDIIHWIDLGEAVLYLFLQIEETQIHWIGEELLSIPSWVDCYAGWLRLCRNQERISGLTWKPSCSSSSRLAARISPHYVVLLRKIETEGKWGRKREKH